MLTDSFPDKELGHLLVETDRQALQYAAECLALATVDVSIQDCDYPFNALPEELQKPFAEIGYPTKNVTRMDMQLQYDRSEKFFVPREVGLHLDNDLRILFSRIRNIKSADYGERAVRWGLFYPQILTPSGKSLVKPDKTFPVTADLLQVMLHDIGVNVPTAPQRADWEAIQRMFYFSDRWSAIVRHSVQLDLITSLYVEERSDGLGYIAETEEADESKIHYVEDRGDGLGYIVEAEEADESESHTDVPHIKELIVGIDTAPDVAERANRSVKYILRAEGDEELPHFADLQRVPLFWDVAFLGELDTIRTERLEKSRFVVPTPEILRKFIATIEQARLLENPFAEA